MCRGLTNRGKVQCYLNLSFLIRLNKSALQRVNLNLTSIKVLYLSAELNAFHIRFSPLTVKPKGLERLDSGALARNYLGKKRTDE